MTHNGRWCYQTIMWTSWCCQGYATASRCNSETSFAPERGWPTMEKLPVDWILTRRQGQGRSRVTTPLQYRFLILLSCRNHMSTTKVLEIDFCRATEVHFPDQIVRNKLHDDGMRARIPAQGPVLIAQHRVMRSNVARQHQNWEIRHWMPVLFTYESSFTESTDY